MFDEPGDVRRVSEVGGSRRRSGKGSPRFAKHAAWILPRTLKMNILGPTVKSYVTIFVPRGVGSPNRTGASICRGAPHGACNLAPTVMRSDADTVLIFSLATAAASVVGCGRPGLETDRKRAIRRSRPADCRTCELERLLHSVRDLRRKPFCPNVGIMLQEIPCSIFACGLIVGHPG